MPSAHKTMKQSSLSEAFHAAVAANPVSMLANLRSDFVRFSDAFLSRLDDALSKAKNASNDVPVVDGYGDPADPRNKQGRNLSPRGVEVAYRMFDAGLNRYQVKEQMQISYGGATYRHNAWEQSGGKNRTSVPISD